MNTIAILTLLAYLSPVDCKKHYHVLTRFKDVQKYALKMVQHTAYNPENMGPLKLKSVRYNFCKSLLAAPVFEFLSEVTNTSFRRADTGLHRIATDAWAELKILCRKKKLPKKKGYIEAKEFSLHVYQCINHDSRFTWLPSYSTEEAVGLLFTTVPVNSVYALIDHSIRIITYYGHMGYEFLRSIEIAGSPKNESLCNLKKESQLRICAICADSLHRRIMMKHLPYHKLENEIPDSEMYADPYFNYIIDDTYGKPENCPIQNVSTLNTPGPEGHSDVEIAALNCDISMKEITYKFYVKRNLNENLETSSVYILKDGKIEGRTSINQLDNILTIDAYL